VTCVCGQHVNGKLLTLTVCVTDRKVINSLGCWWWVLNEGCLMQHDAALWCHHNDDDDPWPVAGDNDDNKHVTFVFVQHVHPTDSSVTLVNAFISHTNVTITATAATAVMNATAVSYKLTCVLLNAWRIPFTVYADLQRSNYQLTHIGKNESSKKHRWQQLSWVELRLVEFKVSRSTHYAAFWRPSSSWFFESWLVQNTYKLNIITTRNNTKT